MKSTICTVWLLLFCGLLWMRADQIPVEDFFRDPEFRNFQVSPDGTHLAFLGPWERRTNIFVYEIATGDARRVTAFRDSQIRDFFWANDERLLFYVEESGFEASIGIFAVDRDGRRSRVLVPPAEAVVNVSVIRQTVVIDRLKDDPEHVLVVNNERRLDYPDVFMLNIYREPRRRMAGARRGASTAIAAQEVERNPGTVRGWFTDQQGRLRLGIRSNRENRTRTVIYRGDENSEWEDLVTFDEGAPGWEPIGFSYDEEILFVSSNLDRNTSGIYTYDLAARELGDLVYAHDEVDVTGLTFSDYRRAPISIRYETDRPQVRWLDEEKKMIQQALDSVFPDTLNRITSMSEDERVLVVRSFSDRHSPFYHLLRIQEGGLNMIPLGHSRKWLDPDRMAPVRPIQYEARDGLSIHGYLTMPRGWKEGDEPVPLVVHPHGGPWVRDSWGFNPEVQFLANRGYAVLQMNFRGSTGYGRSLLRAGDKAWGGEMQTDLKDGVKWAIAEGYADPDRIGIFGASYGGYATMMQLVLYPETYRWGINYVGPVDLRELILHRRRHEEVFAHYSRTIGDPDEDRELLAEHAPITHIERLQAPVFVVHGRNDARVPMNQATMLRQALERHDKEYEWLVKPDEGHGFRNEENVIELYTRIDAFIEKHFR